MISKPPYQRVAGLKSADKHPASDSSSSQFAGLDLHKAVSVLIGPTAHPLQALLKQVLAAGLCARVLQPHNPAAENQAMLIEVASVLAHLEQKFLATGDARAFSRATSSLLIQAVYAQLYYPMGGTAELINACRTSSKQAALRASAVRDLEYLTNAVMILHAYLQEKQPGYAQSDKTHMVPLARLVEAIKGIGLRRIAPAPRRKRIRKSLTVDQVRNYWKGHAEYLALAYAACRIPYPKHGNLLAAIFADAATGPQLVAVAADWIRRAEFARKAVLEKIHFGHRKTKKQALEGASVPPRFVAFKQAQQLEFSPRNYREEDLEKITHTIEKSRRKKRNK